MGIRIAYMGKLRDPKQIGKLEEDISGMCKEMGWTVSTTEELLAEEQTSFQSLRGLILQTSPQCDWLHLTIDPEGRFVNHSFWELAQDYAKRRHLMEMVRENQRQLYALLGEKPQTEFSLDNAAAQNGMWATIPDLSNINIDDGVGYNWINTHPGGVAGHIAVCRVLSYVKEHYAPALEIMDNSGYFNNHKLEELEIKMGEVDFMRERVLRAFKKTISEAPGGECDLREMLAKLNQCLGKDRDMLH
jgi:hypothetical protein